MPDKNEDDALKKKFQQLQQRQHQKLETRKLKKQKNLQKNNSPESTPRTDKPKAPAEVEKPGTPAFGVNDELDLKVSTFRCQAGVFGGAGMP